MPNGAEQNGTRRNGTETKRKPTTASTRVVASRADDNEPSDEMHSATLGHSHPARGCISSGLRRRRSSSQPGKTGRRGLCSGEPQPAPTQVHLSRAAHLASCMRPVSALARCSPLSQCAWRPLRMLPSRRRAPPRPFRPRRQVARSARRRVEWKMVRRGKPSCVRLLAPYCRHFATATLTPTATTTPAVATTITASSRTCTLLTPALAPLKGRCARRCEGA